MDPETGAIVNEFGDGLTMALAIESETGLIYVSSGKGVEIFDPVTQQFSHYSRDLNLRVGSLAFAPDGSLWAATWPDRHQVIRFTDRARGELMLTFETDIDSVAFGRPGTELEGLLFVSHNSGEDSADSELTMVDLATLRSIALATGGSRGDVVLTTSDGRLLLSQSHQVDVINPALPPVVLAANPPPAGVAVLPLQYLSITFDQDMLALGQEDLYSVENPGNYTLTGQASGAVAFRSVLYVPETFTVFLTPDPLAPDDYELTLSENISSIQGLTLAESYTTTFTAITNLSDFVDIEFSDARSNRADGTVSYDVVITNTSQAELLLPIILVLDPAQGYLGVPQQAIGQAPDGRWFVDLSDALPAGQGLAPGQSTTGRTITIRNPAGRKVDYDTGVSSQLAPNAAPVFDSQPVTEAVAGQVYTYQAQAHDPESTALVFILYQGPTDMTVDPYTGLVSWSPTPESPAEVSVILDVYDNLGARSSQQYTLDVDGGNRQPQLGALPETITGAEGLPLEINVYATDPDGDPLIYLADNLPPGAVFDAAQHRFTWTPGYEANGTYEDLTFIVTDGINQVTAETTLLISDVDRGPVLLKPADRTLREGDRLRFYLQGEDPDGDPVQFSSRLLAPGALLDPNTGLFDWTPSFFQAGEYHIPFTVSNEDGSATETMVLTVTNANGAPIFDQMDGWRIYEGEMVAFITFARDPDNPGFTLPFRLPDDTLFYPEFGEPTVTYAVQDLPDGASFDAETALFAWIPAFGDLGEHLVTFTATDDGDSTGTVLTTSVTVPVTVLNLNRPPEIPEIDNVLVPRDEVLDLDVQVTDPDGNPLVLSATSALPGYALPDFATFTDNGDGTGRFHFAPVVGHRGDYVITLHAADDGDGDGPDAIQTTYYSFNVQVDSPNEPPIFDYIGDKVAVAGEPFELTVRCHDMDQESLAFEVTGLPAAASLTPGAVYGTATLNWTPTAQDLDTYVVTFTVTDGGNGNPNLVETDSKQITLAVRLTNQVPVLDPVGNRTLAEGDLLTLQLAGQDNDGDALTYSAENLPGGAYFDARTGTLTWTPSLNQAGAYEDILVTVSDGLGTSSETVSITVTNINQSPRLVPVGKQYGREGATLIFSIVAVDYDEDPLVYTVASGLPEGAILNPSTGQFSWKPGYEQAGHYPITFAAQDPEGLFDTYEAFITIDNVNRAPIPHTSDHSAKLGEPLSFFVTASDPDLNTAFTYAAEGLPEGATLDETTGQFNWTPGPGQAGEYVVTLEVSDGLATVPQWIVIKAAVEPEKPQVHVELTPSFPAIPGQSVLVHAIADSLADITDLVVTVDGEVLILDAEGRAWFTARNIGQTTVEAVATDADGLQGRAAVQLKVRDPEDKTVPQVSFDETLLGRVLFEATDVIGTVADTNLDSWQLEIAPAGSEDFAVIASGLEPVDDDVFIGIDPAQMTNGFYVLRLWARDISGRQSQTRITLEVNTSFKPAAYQRAEIDLALDLGGVSVQLQRSYDSLQPDTAGTFGYGWRLANRETDIQTNILPTGQEEFGLFNAFRLGTRLYLTTPEGERLGFTFGPQRHELGAAVYYTPAWQADPGGTYALASVDAMLAKAGSRFYDQATGQPYNPANPFFTGADYKLTDPDNTRYLIDTERGVNETITPAGAHLFYTDSGITAAGGQAIQFMHDDAGRLQRIIAPDGTVLQYQYNDIGNLVAVRNVTTGAATRYGYDPTDPHLLTSAVTGGAAGQAILYEGTPVTAPVLADLGGAGTFASLTTLGTLAADTTDRYTFSIRASEIGSTPTDWILLRVAVTTDNSDLHPALPTLAGLDAVSTHVDTDQAVALYAVEREGLYLLALSGGDTATAGDYQLQLSVAGDINDDGRVDGLDTQLLADAQGTALGDPRYEFAADLDGNGVVNVNDTFVLTNNYGFIANQAPQINPVMPEVMTHEDLQVQVDLAQVATDPDGDPIYYRVAGVTNGQVVLTSDGQFAIFTPAPGFAGEASFEFVADDGFNSSGVGTVEVTVSDAPLIDLRVNLTSVILQLGETTELVVTGDFADQVGVELPLSYVTAQVIDGYVASLATNGIIQAVSEGTTILTVSRGNLLDAAAIGVESIPDEYDDYGPFLGMDFIEVYPQALTLPGAGATRQMLVGRSSEYDLGEASAGTYYFVSDSGVLSVSADGLVTAAAEGTARVIMINGVGQAEVPVLIEAPHVGPTVLGEQGGSVATGDGTTVSIGPGALGEEVMVSIDSVAEADIPLVVPEDYAFIGAFDLDLGEAELTEVAQLAVPVDPSIPTGEEVYFFRREFLMDPDGVVQDLWILMDSGVVGEDSTARTTSPPYPGFSEGGEYLCARADFPERSVELELGVIVAATASSLIPPVAVSSYAQLGDGKNNVKLLDNFGKFSFSYVPVITVDIWVYPADKNPLNWTPVVQRTTIHVPEGVQFVEGTVTAIVPILDEPVINEIGVQILDPSGSPSDPDWNWNPRVTIEGANLKDIRLYGEYGGTKYDLTDNIVWQALDGSAMRFEIEDNADYVVGDTDFYIEDTSGRRSNTVRIGPKGLLGFANVSNQQVAVFEAELPEARITEILRAPENGLVEITNDGADVTYEPNPGYSGLDSFEYRLKDMDGLTHEATVNIEVKNPAGDQIAANSDSFTVLEDSGKTMIDVLANDTYLPNALEALMIRAITQGPTHGQVTITGGGTKLTYELDSNYAGPDGTVDTFTYEVSSISGTAVSTTATVSLTITDKADPLLIANNDRFTMLMDSGEYTLDVRVNDLHFVDANRLVRFMMDDVGVIRDVAITHDYSRAYVATSKGVALVDAITLRQVYANPPGPSPTSPRSLFIDKDSMGTVLPTIQALVMDPADRFLYALGHSPIVYVVDLRPGDDLHEVTEIKLDPSYEWSGNAIAVSADGRRLYVGANSSTANDILVINIDEWDKPEPSSTTNTRNWHKVIKTINVEGEVSKIIASPDSSKLAFTYKFRGLLHPWVKFGILGVTKDDPTDFKVDLGEVSTSMPGYQAMLSDAYYLGIWQPRDIAFTPDLKYAFVAGWDIEYSPLPDGSGGMLYKPLPGQRGGKVGVVQNPFDLDSIVDSNDEKIQSRLVGATTPIQGGLTEHLAFSADRDLLFVSYAGMREILVLDTTKLSKTIEDVEDPEDPNNPLDVDLSKVPLDQIMDPDDPEEPDPRYDPHVKPITTYDASSRKGGRPLDIVVQNDAKDVQVEGKLGDVISVDLKKEYPTARNFEIVGISTPLLGKIIRYGGRDILTWMSPSPGMPGAPVQPITSISFRDTGKFFVVPRIDLWNLERLRLGTPPYEPRFRGTFGMTIDGQPHTGTFTVNVSDGFTSFDLDDSVGENKKNNLLDVYRVQQRLKYFGYPGYTSREKGIGQKAELLVTGQWDHPRLSGDEIVNEMAVKLFQAATHDDDPFDPRKDQNGNIIWVDGIVSQDKTDISTQAIDWLTSPNAPRWQELHDADSRRGFGLGNFDIMRGMNQLERYGTDWAVRLVDHAASAIGIPMLPLPGIQISGISDEYGDTPPDIHKTHNAGLDIDVDTPGTNNGSEAFYLVHKINDNSLIAAGENHIIENIDNRYTRQRFRGDLNTPDLTISVDLDGQLTFYLADHDFELDPGSTKIHISKVSYAHPSYKDIEGRDFTVDKVIDPDHFTVLGAEVADVSSSFTDMHVEWRLSDWELGRDKYIKNVVGSKSSEATVDNTDLLWAIRNMLVDNPRLWDTVTQQWISYSPENVRDVVLKFYEAAESLKIDGTLADVGISMNSVVFNDPRLWNYDAKDADGNVIETRQGPKAQELIDKGITVTPLRTHGGHVHINVKPPTTPSALLVNSRTGPQEETITNLDDEYDFEFVNDIIYRSWKSIGVTEDDLSELNAVQFEISELSVKTLALTSENTITLDTDAAGYGWFIDETPWDNEEFTNTVYDWELHADANSPAAGKIDLLTVLMHEMGHVLGLPDVSAGIDPTRIMTGILAPGVRRLPSELDLTTLPQEPGSPESDPSTGLVAVDYSDFIRRLHESDGTESGVVEAQHQDTYDPDHLKVGISNGTFTIADEKDPGFGWSLMSDASVQGGVAVLDEGRAFFSGISQTFIIPDGAERLRFVIDSAVLGATAGNPGDAFEVALLDADTMTSLIGTATGLNNTDAFLNVQGAGTTYISPAISIAGLNASGGVLSLADSIVVEVDLSGVPPGTVAALYFDLLGFGEVDSQVIIDNVFILTGAEVPPIAVSDTVTTYVNDEAIIDILANDVDPDGDIDPGSVVIVAGAGPEHGSIAVNSQTGLVTYQPQTDYYGEDAFGYTVQDNSGIESNEATVTINVRRPNTLSVVRADSYVSSEDIALVVGPQAGVLANDTDADDHDLTALLVQGPAHGSLTLNADGSFTYIPNQDFHGNDSFVYKVYDGIDESDQAAVDITVEPVNDNPVTGADRYVVREDGTLTTPAPGILFNDSDLDGDSLTASLETIDPAYGQVAVNTDGSFTYMPAENFSGIATFTYLVEDGHGGQAAGTVTITVNPVNDAPIAVDDVYPINEGAILAVDPADGVLANDSDVDGDLLEASLESGPANGTVTLNSDGSFEYIATDYFNGADFFTYLIGDGNAGTSTAVVSITVNPVNDPPVGVDDVYATDEDTSLVVDVLHGVLGNDNDVDSGSLTAELLADVSHGVLTLSSNGSFQYIPDPDFRGLETFMYQANDGSADSNETAVMIVVNPTNDAPVAIDDAYSVDEDITLTVDAANGVLANDSDIDNDTLAVVLLTEVAHGDLSLNPDGSFDYTPDSEFSGTDSFTYRASDGRGGEVSATVTITVNPINDVPQATGDTYSVDEDNVLAVDAPTGVLANDTDIEGDLLTAALESGPTNGVLVLNSDGSFEYTPEDNFHGQDSFVYRADDGNGGQTPATAVITVNPIADSPVAVDDGYTTNEDASLTIDAAQGVLANDYDVDGDPLAAELLTDVSHGVLTFNSNGSFQYLPEANFHGLDSFTYQVSDGSTNSNETTVTITVNPINDVPVALNDTYSMADEAALVVYAAEGVLANDSDVDGDALSASVESGPANGSLALNADGSFTYTPVGGFAGDDFFTYRASDGHGGQDDATVVIAVNPSNQAPATNNDTYNIDEDGSLSVDASQGVLSNDEDVNNDILTAALISGPSHGALTLNSDGSFSYTPVTDFHGADSFTYRASDGQGGSATGTVSITVNPVNDAPVAVDDAYTIDEGTSLTAAAPGVLGNDTDVDGDPLTTILATDASHGTLTLNANGSFTYEPDQDFSGTDSFTYRANDGASDSNVATVTINLELVNTAPVVVDDSYSTREDTTLTVVSPGVLDNDTDVDGDSLSAILDTDASDGILTLNSDGSFTYSPDADFNGTDSFTYHANDGAADSNTATVTITITSVNDAPVANDDEYGTDEDTPLTIAPPAVLGNDSDVDGDSLTAMLDTDVSNGTLALNADGSFSYTSDADFSGVDSFTYVANDGLLDSNVATVTLTVNAVNDPPVADDDVYATDEDTPLNAAAPGVLANDSDVDGDGLTAVLVTDVGHGSLTLNADGSFTYTPDPNFNGVDSFTYVANDGLADSNVATVTITVSPVNDAPVATDDAYTTDEGTPLTVGTPGVLGNDSDVDGDPLTVVLDIGPGNGTLTLNSDGSFAYTPNANFNGADGFTYHANDGVADSNIVTVTLTVSPVNDAPTADDNAYTTDEDTPLTVAAPGVLGNDSDVDGDSLRAVLDIGPDNGTLTLNSGGSFTYTPNANFNGADSFTYHANDGVADSNIVAVTLTINPDNDAPVAVDDAYSTNEDATLTIAVPDVLGNDGDVDGDSLTAVLDTAVTNGVLTLNSDGSFTYAPNANFNGTDAFTYTSSDGSGGTDTATVTVTVTSVNDAPVANDDSQSVAEGGTVNVDVVANDTDIDGTIDPATVAIITGPSSGSLVVNGDGTVDYTHDGSETTGDSFTYTVNDNEGATSNVATVSISVTPVNDAPVAADDAYQTDEDTWLTVAAPGVMATDSDVDGDPLAVILGTDVSNGTLTFNADGSFSYTPNPEFNGIDSFTYHATDGLLGSNVATVLITVNPIDDAPVAIDDAYNTDEDTPLTVSGSGILANDFDYDADPLTAVLYGGVVNGTLTLNGDGSFSYTPDAHFNGIDSFAYYANDGLLDSSIATVIITVDPINDSPVADPNGPYSGMVGSPVSFDGSGSTDIDGTLVSYAWDFGDANTGSGVNPTHTYGAAGLYTVTLTVTDDGGLTDTATTTVDIQPVPNQPPVAVDDAYVMDEDSVLNMTVPGVMDDDSDPDGDPLMAVLDADVTNGTLTLSEDGSFAYTPDVNFSGVDSFTYHVNDGREDSNIATVTITVNPVNDAPVANNDAATTNKDTPVDIDVLANDTDADGDSLSINSVIQPANGSVVVNSDNTLTYTPLAGFTGEDSFTYTISDGNGGTDTATVTITVNDTSEPPKVIDDLAARAKDGKVQLTWTDTGADHYNVYRSTTAGGPYTLIASTTSTYSTYLDTDVVTGTTYYYVVRPVLANGDELDQSNEASATPIARVRRRR